MECVVCGRSPAEGATVFRINPKGEKGIWVCDSHAQSDDPIVNEVVKAIQEGRTP
jgi:hypothetical protein